MRSIALLLLCFIVLHVSGQTGKIEGKITDSKTGAALAGVTVTTSVSAKGTATDVDGRYVITLNTGIYTLHISSVGYQVKEIENVQVTAGTVNTLDILLESAAKTETEVVVKSSRKLESIASLISYQKNTNTVAQVVSSESIKRSPDKNTGEVLKRVPGTSIQDGKYLVVRGLADRYNQAMLNGILLSSTEPDKKTFSFDIFPAATIDNIIINKAFVPELPGEWAGGLVQVNTKDVPASTFFTIQIGTGFNTQTAGHDFYKYHGGRFDFLGFDDGARALPSALPLKNAFNNLAQSEKTVYGTQFSNEWSAHAINGPLLNQSFQLGTGFSKKLGQKNKLGAVLGLNYNRSVRRTEFENRIYSIQNNLASLNFDYFNNKYSQDVLLGALGNITLQLGSNHKISFKNILNINTANYTTLRTGKDFESNSVIGDNIRASELAFKANTFFNTIISGDHNFPAYRSKLHWYGSFNILDQYIPDQRRIQYNQDDPDNANSAWSLLISSSQTSQKSGSRYYGFLNDYIYTTGADATKNFLINEEQQSMKLGYFFQVKDRLFDSRPFSIYLPSDNPSLKHLPADEVFSASNFGNGFNNKFAFNEIYDIRYRYIANSILNAGFLQFDNRLSDNIRAVWGLRLENFDQLVGSTGKNDPRHVHSNVTDFLPGINFTYKINNKINVRVSGSQTVVRPEFRELSGFAFYDFDLGATVTGSPSLERTKITNGDARFELYARAGELFTLGFFYKYFNKPIELFFNQTGAGSSSTFNYINAESAHSYGAELEFRKKLDFSNALKNFTVNGNLSYIYNRVTGLKRPMQGQSPYLLNFGLQYDIEKAGLNTTLLFNQIGRRIYYVGSTSSNGTINNDSYPPVWEAPRALLDFQVAKKILGKKGEIKLNVNDLLNQAAHYYHDLNDNKKYDPSNDALAIKRKYGTGISLSFGYNL